MMKSKALLLILLALGIVGCTSYQPAKIQVSDSETDLPVPGIEIRVGYITPRESKIRLRPPIVFSDESGIAKPKIYLDWEYHSPVASAEWVIPTFTVQSDDYEVFLHVLTSSEVDNLRSGKPFEIQLIPKDSTQGGRASK